MSIKLYRDNSGKIEPFKFRLNDPVESKTTGKKGIIQGIYKKNSDLFMIFTGDGYERLKESDLVLIKKEELPFRYDLHKVDEDTEPHM